MTIRDRIVECRRDRVSREGHSLGVEVPETRSVPVVPLLGDPPLICEVKRRSPSRGSIDEALDPIELVGTYSGHGARAVSVLTEEDYFHGNLADLIQIKARYPGLAVLRKDFLIDVEDVRVSYRAGADAVLMIASVLSQGVMAEMLSEVSSLGMTALVELHDTEDVEKARPLKPRIIGINARNLADFSVDLLAPIRLHDQVDWTHKCVFESGLFTRNHARLVMTSGFDAALVGEAVVRDPGAIPQLIQGLKLEEAPRFSHPAGGFWRTLSLRKVPGRPLVKICGITNREDAELAVSLGADVIGFILAESPRQVGPELVKDLSDIDVLKAGVVVSGGRHGPLSRELGDLLSTGALDVIQFHGDETPEECVSTAFPYYRAIRPRNRDDVAAMRDYDCPRVLVDARSETGYGGTGKTVAEDIVDAASVQPLWLAGGLNDRNIGEIVLRFRPELVDVSSGLEERPGKKDPGKLERFFEEISNAEVV